MPDWRRVVKAYAEAIQDKEAFFVEILTWVEVISGARTAPESLKWRKWRRREIRRRATRSRSPSRFASCLLVKFSESGWQLVHRDGGVRVRTGRLEQRIPARLLGSYSRLASVTHSQQETADCYGRGHCFVHQTRRAWIMANRLTQTGVLVSVLLLGCAGCGRIATNNAIAEIQMQDGGVYCDENRPGRPVIWVEFMGPRVTDAGLAHLKGLPQLQTLDLGLHAQVTEAGLKHLEA